jgi:uncharacterized membrane protein
MRRKSFTFFGRSSSLLLLIFYKLLMALVEMLAGSLCLLTAFFAKHLEVVRVIKESAGEDQLDQFVRWLTEHLLLLKTDHELIMHIGLVLIALGIFKIFVAIGLWFRSTKMRIVALVLFGALACYSSYELFLSFSIFKSIALVFDLFIIYYFWKILPKHLE